MDQQIVFTMSDAVTAFSAFAGFLVSINAAILVIIAWYKRIHKPEDVQNERIKALEDRVTELERWREDMKNEHIETIVHLREIENNNNKFQRAMIESLHALSNHAIDGNHTDDLKKAARNLNNYILDQMWEDK